MNGFHMRMVGYYHFNLFSHQIIYIKRVLNLMLYKTDFLVLEFKKPFIKTKNKFIKLNY
jgi:hypothetical protein